MSMYTRCSSCNTHFKVTVQQLQACSGQVRCGRCTTVFDAFASLTARLPGQDDEPPPLVPSERSPWQAPELAAAGATMAAVPAEEEATPSAAFIEASLARSSSVFSVAGAGETLSLGVGAPEVRDSAKLSLPENLFGRRPGDALPGPTWAWHIGIGLLALLAVLQMTLFFRAELAAGTPSLRGPLMALCKPFSCDVPLPRYPDSLFIESSDLQVVDTRRPQEVLLTAALRNRADRLQAYPSLELTLTNTMDQPVAKRVFPPREYLPDSVNAALGFAPGAEVNLRLMLNTADVRASGYRLYLFFPN